MVFWNDNWWLRSMQFFLWEFCKFEFKSTIYLLHQKDLPMQKKRHIMLQYHIEIQCHIKLAVCLHIFLKGYLRLFHFALLELSTKELQLQIKKLKSIWAESFIKYFYWSCQIYVHLHTSTQRFFRIAIK